MIIFVIFNLLFSTLLIIGAIFFIKNINDHMKECEKYKKYDIEVTNKQIKIAKIFKLFNYVVIVLCVSSIELTLFIFITNLLEVL